MRSALVCILIFFCLLLKAQFPPAAGLDGSTAIYADSSIIIGWSSLCAVQRGWVDISDTSLGRTDFGTGPDAAGKADNVVVSLGDGGTAVLSFHSPVTNGAGPDFAVFENAFNDEFLELAFVEVSSDGLHYFRFPSVSLTQTDSQTTTFGVLDPTKINNLAGKYIAMYGTPFDLDDIPDDPLLDKNHITQIRIIDAVGSVQPEFATYDSQGNIINDPWPTPFNTGGFDLDAVGVINSASIVPDVKEETLPFIYPTPAESEIRVRPGSEFSEGYSVIFYNTYGFPAFIHYSNAQESVIDISQLPAGVYEIKITGNNLVKSGRIVKL